MKTLSCIAALLIGASIVAPVAAHAADTFPGSKRVRLIVGYTPGGASDIVGRLVAKGMAEVNGGNFIVENRPGDGGMVGMAYVKNAPADGSVLGIAVSGTLVTGPHLQKNVPYDALTSFADVGKIAKAPMVMFASPSYKDPTVAHVIADAKAHPGQMKSAQGAKAFELAQHLFNSLAGVNIGIVPYPGGAQAAIDVMAGRVTLMVDTIGAQIGAIKGGKLVPVAVLDSKRSPLLPKVPTMQEEGVKDYEAVGWMGLVAPKGTPPEVVAKINADLNKALALPEVKEKLQSLGYDPDPSTPAQFQETVNKEFAKWGKVCKDAGIQPS
ncbi:tripartite tricarboxylate transporter substrate binding protein [Paraburkholderia sp. CNPSo 3157]|uniref:Tripartite tricarboxylate transporter substrate binding protein n=1 Tax=Paraburkholderia franconis TaxID=2654983 RepID=A0A7X1TJZ3_9BURK|nr:tripartite tricarboxylate transporter substrate-binding protein [Paraburkholderia franconis]MPW22046.1 tripartite tricarboxylate transporter substrate binding protein [Paraburkholderia franconis]